MMQAVHYISNNEKINQKLKTLFCNNNFQYEKY